MLRQMRNFGLVSLTAVIAALLLASPSAASIIYGDFAGNAVTYTDVTESSITDPVPLYGPPAVFGDILDFNPIAFGAFSEFGPPDITDGQLNFGIESEIGLNSLTISESGDFSLAGMGGAGTSVVANLLVSIEVLEIAGVAIDPMMMGEASIFEQDLSMGSGGDFWSASVSFDFSMFDGPVTRVAVVIDNQLLADSEIDSIAFIAKKDFEIVPGVVPEPMTAALLALGLGLLGAASRSRA